MQLCKVNSITKNNFTISAEIGFGVPPPLGSDTSARVGDPVASTRRGACCRQASQTVVGLRHGNTFAAPYASAHVDGPRRVPLASAGWPWAITGRM